MRRAVQTFSRYIVVVAFAFAGAYPAASQQTKKSEVAKFKDDIKISTSVFSGNESRIGLLTNFQSNCEAVLPDVRIMEQPINGEIQLDAVKSVFSFDRDSRWADCNGKAVDVVGVFYKSKENFVGEDRVILEVDYKIGLVQRRTYVVNVR